MKLSRTQQRILVYVGGIATIVGGAYLTKIDITAGIALVTAGGGVMGMLQKEMLPRQHRRKDDPPEPETKKEG